jgi:hypothetical protein
MECRQSGLSDHQWCLVNDINPSTFYNWINRNRKRGMAIPMSSDNVKNTSTPLQEVVKVDLVPDSKSIPAPYVLNIAFNKNKGEIVEGKSLELDLKKIEEEKKYDGYYSIVTSELNMSDAEMREVYRGLIRIEDTFKISKTEFDSRPIFVRTNDHIDAHVTTCFTALVLIRLLQTKLENKYPVGKIINAMKSYCCVPFDTKTYQFTYYDEILAACGRTFDMELDNKYRTRQQIQHLLRY